MTVYSKNISDDLLVKFLLGESETNETSLVTDWLSESNENQKYLNKLELTWIESGKLTLKPVAVDTPFAWDKMSERIDSLEQEKERAKVIVLRKSAFRFTSSIAAILIVAFGVFKFVQSNFIDNVLVADNAMPVNTILSDGSAIVLNKNSKLSYPKKFRGDAREVKLTGEAFFKVQANPQKPFIIDAGAAKIKVLGTQFNVKASKNGSVEVIVTEGTVKLFSIDSISLDTNSVILQAGQRGILDNEYRVPSKVVVNKPDALFWMNKTLIFQGTRLRRVINLLEKNYHVSIDVSNPELYNCQLTSTFQNSTADEILEVIAFTFNINLNHENNTYILQGESCDSN